MQRTWSRQRAAVLVLAIALSLAAGAAVEAAGTKSPSGGGEGVNTPIDINRASEAELTAIPGVGKALAQRIVEFREKNGPYRRVEDLLKVKGIGEKSFEKIRAHVKVSKQS